MENWKVIVGMIILRSVEIRYRPTLVKKDSIHIEAWSDNPHRGIYF